MGLIPFNQVLRDLEGFIMQVAFKSSNLSAGRHPDRTLSRRLSQTSQPHDGPTCNIRANSLFINLHGLGDDTARVDCFVKSFVSFLSTGPFPVTADGELR